MIGTDMQSSWQTYKTCPSWSEADRYRESLVNDKRLYGRVRVRQEGGNYLVEVLR